MCLCMLFSLIDQFCHGLVYFTLLFKKIILCILLVISILFLFAILLLCAPFHVISLFPFLCRFFAVSFPTAYVKSSFVYFQMTYFLIYTFITGNLLLSDYRIPGVIICTTFTVIQL